MHHEDLGFFGKMELFYPKQSQFFVHLIAGHQHRGKQPEFADVFFPKFCGKGGGVWDFIGQFDEPRLVDSEIDAIGEPLLTHRTAQHAVHCGAEHLFDFADLVFER